MVSKQRPLNNTNIVFFVAIGSVTLLGRVAHSSPDLA
jgi:hypothetical protein